MEYGKVDLATNQIVEIPSVPPKMPKQYLADPGSAYDIGPGRVTHDGGKTFVIEVIDELPASVRGFGWYKIINVNTHNSITQTRGNVISTVSDAGSGTITRTYGAVAKLQAEIDAYYDAVEASIHVDIRASVHEYILSLVPIWKQINMLAAGTDLNKKARGGPLSQAEQDEEATLVVTWTQMKALRAASDAAEAAVTAAKGDENAMLLASVVDWSAV